MDKRIVVPIQVSSSWRYLFIVATDYATTAAEREMIETDILGPMLELGALTDSIGIMVFKNQVSSHGATPDYEVNEQGRYLLLIRQESEDGGYTDDPDWTSAQAIKEFSYFTGGSTKNIRAVVIDNSYFEVLVNKSFDKEPRAYGQVFK